MLTGHTRGGAFLLFKWEPIQGYNYEENRTLVLYSTSIASDQIDLVDLVYKSHLALARLCWSPSAVNKIYQANLS